jgi:ADP-heptose:LPS heptosyltransferase
MEKLFKNILIIGHSNIGDVCYDLAVIAPLRSNFKQAKINLLTSSRAKELVENYPGIDEIIIFDKHGKDKGIFGQIVLVQSLRKERFDLVIVLNKSLLFNFLGASTVWRIEEKLRKDKSGDFIHVVDSYLSLLRSKGVSVAEKLIFNFRFDNQEVNFAKNFFAKNSIADSDKVISISPYANWSLKCWPVTKWNELIKVLNKEYKVIVVGKEGADSYSKIVSREISKQVISAVNQCSLKQSMMIIKRSQIFISCDSSLLHIASCMQIPSIGLYGPTAIGAYYPYFHQDFVIKGEDVPDCTPCLNSKNFARCKAEGKSPCMLAINVEQVLGRIHQLIDSV